MADLKISELPAATTPLDGTELMEVVQGGVNKKVAKSDVSSGGGGTWGSITGTLSSQTDLNTALGLKAPLASPALTGTPTAPTAAGGTNTTQIATTAFVLAAQLSSVSTSTAGGTITLDMNSQIQRMHVGSASFATPKTIAMSNTTGSLVFNLFINVTNVAAVITVPADWFMSDIQFDGSAWTPPETGRYELGGSFDGTNWWVKIQGPFS